MNKHFKIANITIFLFSISIIFYAGKITSISPIYVIYLLTIFFSIFSFLKKDNLIFSHDMLVVFVLLVYTLVTQMQYSSNGAFINLVLALISYLYIRGFQKRVGIDSLLKSFYYMVIVSSILLLLDSIYRITHPTAASLEAMNYLSSSEDLFFYLYKVNSILFFDSNTTGLVALILFFSVLSLEKKNFFNKNFYKYSKILLFLIILSSLSRAAYVGFLLGYTYYYYINSKMTMKLTFVVLIITISLFLYSILYTYLENDLSFQSKFIIFDLIINKLDSLSLYQVLFGVGFGESINTIGKFTHILVITYLYEMGVIGLILFIAFVWFYIYRFSSIVLVPVLITSLSFFTYVGTPFLFVPLALIANILTITTGVIKK